MFDEQILLHLITFFLEPWPCRLGSKCVLSFGLVPVTTKQVQSQTHFIIENLPHFTKCKVRNMIHTSKDFEVWLAVVEGSEAGFRRRFLLLWVLCRFCQLLTRFGSWLSNLTGNPLSFLYAAFGRFLVKWNCIIFCTILTMTIQILCTLKKGLHLLK